MEPGRMWMKIFCQCGCDLVRLIRLAPDGEWRIHCAGHGCTRETLPLLATLELTDAADAAGEKE
jgi:hypothetical protein